MMTYRSSQFSGSDDVEAAGESNVTTVYSPKSGVSLLNLGDFEAAWDASVQRARPQVRTLGPTMASTYAKDSLAHPANRQRRQCSWQSWCRFDSGAIFALPCADGEAAQCAASRR